MKQTHRIRRQVVELEVPAEADAAPLYDRVSRIHRERLLPVLDEVCSELSDPDSIHRIARLELDLGRIDVSRLDEELAHRLRAALRSALQAEIARAAAPAAEREAALGAAGPAAERAAAPEGAGPAAEGEAPFRGAGSVHESPAGGTRIQSQLELLALFVRTGTLPWWADAARSDVVERALRTLLKNAPAALVRLAREVVGERRALVRIAATFDDALLGELCARLAPSLSAPVVLDLVRLLVDRAPGAQDARRRATWFSLLRALALRAGEPREPVATCEDALLSFALEARCTYSSVVSELHAAAGQAPAVQAEIVRLAQVLEREARGAEAGDVEAQRTEIVRLLTRLEQTRTAPSKLCSVLLGIVERLPEKLHGAWLTVLVALARSGRAARAADVRRGLHELLQTTAAHRLLPAEELARQLEQLEPDQEEGMPLDVTFSESDELYVENAGLVVLWPFLARFFEYRGLLEEGAFKDAASAQRAVGLLQYLATADREPPEFVLALAKLLCGLPLEDVFDFGPPISEEEIEACDELLRAVITSAPILNEMSTEGFRSSFLMRKGVLGVSGGAWLLRVERETHDVVLDRFPWSLVWIKLPWMEAPLRVDW